MVFHIGAHETDGDALVRALLFNRETLREHGVTVPAPSRYRKVMQEAVNTLRGARASAETEAGVLAAISEDEKTEVLVLSNPQFLCLPDRVLDNGELYARAFKTAWLRGVFPSAEVTFAMGMRNPATFIPALYAQTEQKALDFEEYLMGIEPGELRWSDALARIREAAPEAGLVVWCNEDTPLLWPDILRAVTGVDEDARLRGGYDLALQLMTDEGRAALGRAMERRAVGAQAGLRALVAQHLERYAIEGVMDEVIDLPGWTEELIAELTAAYDTDMRRVAAMPGVTFVSG